MEIGYQNAVTDKLCVLIGPEELTVCISSKIGHPKYFLQVGGSDLDEVKSLFSTCIFSNTSVIFCNSPFVLCPSGLSPTEQHALFGLSHEERSDLHTKDLNEEIDVVFAPNPLYASIKDLLVNPVIYSDIGILDSYKGALSMSNAIYLSKLQNQITVRVYSGSKVLLFNRYQVANLDDVFYYVMLAVEQLHVDLSSAHFEFIGSEEDFEACGDMFRNYLPRMLKLPLLDVEVKDLNNSSSFEKDWMSRVALQCV